MNRKQRHAQAMPLTVTAATLKASKLRDLAPWLLRLKQFRRLLRRKRERIEPINGDAK